jgi:hypothetical protein
MQEKSPSLRLLGKQQDFLEFTGISSEERAVAGQLRAYRGTITREIRQT